MNLESDNTDMMKIYYLTMILQRMTVNMVKTQKIC